jgi:enoyl-CoA hydratase
MSKPFNTRITDGIAEMTLDHPPVNAFDSAGWFAIAREIDELGENDDVRVIIICAAGKGFCAGVDIKELAAEPGRIVDVNKGNYETFRAIHRNPKPVIAALHSFVLGGGIGMAGAADIILCSDCARFGVPEIDRGAMGGGAHLQRMFPVQKVRYMYFTGEFIAEKSPAMVKLAKEALSGIEDGNLEDKYRWEQGFTLEAYTMEDSRETRDAFVGKRDVKFRD